MSRDLYSERSGQSRVLKAGDFMVLVWKVIAAMREAGHFNEALGHHNKRGLGAWEPRLSEADFIRRFKVAGIYPTVDSPGGHPPGWFDDDVPLMFDVIEYLYAEATPQDLRDDFRSRLNPDLALYEPAMEMLANGQIVEQAPDYLRPLLEEPIPEDVTLPIRKPFEAAIEQFRRRGATADDKRSAVKHLADVLEPMKGEIKDYVLSADESALFDIANNFYVRHNNRCQHRSYDGEVWLDWMFYVYAATARAMMAVMDRDELRDRVMGEPPDDNGGIAF